MLRGCEAAAEPSSERRTRRIDVDDLDASIEKVTAAGGQIAMPKMAVEGIGWLAYFLDPGNNVIGMMQMDPTAK